MWLGEGCSRVTRLGGGRHALDSDPRSHTLSSCGMARVIRHSALDVLNQSTIISHHIGIKDDLRSLLDWTLSIWRSDWENDPLVRYSESLGHQLQIFIFLRFYFEIISHL